MTEMSPDDVETEAWLLSGITGNIPGVLSLADGRFAFVTDDGQVVIDAPVADVRDVKVPWYYFGGGMKLSVGTERYRLSFVRPTALGGGVGDIPEGRRACKLWRSLLDPGSASG
jgi:hypothetical protein